MVKMSKRFGGKGTITATVVAILMLLIGIEMGDVVVTQVDAINTTGWSYTGYQIVEAVIDLIPLMYYVGVVVSSGMAFLNIR